MDSLKPDDIRKLRGQRSRAEFARLVGVTPLTVYRWELPPAAAQARRPRGRVATRLTELAAGAAPSPATEVAQPMDAVEQTELLPLLGRASAGDLRRVEGELLAAMASGRLCTLAARAMAAQALARLLLFSRVDICGAFAALAPFLGELHRLPPFVELEGQLTAALVFSWPDGRFLDIGKASAHLRRAEKLLPEVGTPEARFLAAMVRVTLALALGTPELMAGVLEQAAGFADSMGSPLYRALLLEGQGQGAAYEGRTDAAARVLTQAAEQGVVGISRVRALSMLASMSFHDARPPSEALGYLARARELAVQSRLAPGVHLMVLDTLEGAALTRLARFAEAEKALTAAIETAAELRWSPVYPAIALARLHFYMGRGEALGALSQRLAQFDASLAPPLTAALGRVLGAAAEVLRAPQRRDAALTETLAQIDEAEKEIGWHDLRGDVLLAAAQLASRFGTVEQASQTLWKAERHFERFPSTCVTAVLRAARGATLAREGRLEEAKQALQSALGTLTLAEDTGNALSARLALAQICAALGEAGAQERIDAHRAELERLGFARGQELRGLEPKAGARPTATSARPVDRLIVPLQRLAVRGMSPALILRELVAVISEQAPGAEVWLEELESTGRRTPIERIGPGALEPTHWAELSDGAGRRLRLGVSGARPGSDAHGLATALCTVAELALELAALRAFSGPHQAAQAASDTVLPELPGFVSASAPMQRLKADLVRLSRSRSTVIISGESGSGKEVVARAIHQLSTRAGKPYVTFNCAAVPRELFEGQLFGYRKGAFTGATADQAGVLRAASGGTVLLDEIGELPLDVQPKLLRFLENGEIHPLGEQRPVRLDVRVIAATFRDLEELVRERRFREDLFYRLQVVTLRVPPLRERPEDVVALARHFIRALTPAGREVPVLAPDALAALHSHRWPGNVRELRNVIERSLAFEPLPPVLGAGQLRLAAS